MTKMCCRYLFCLFILSHLVYTYRVYVKFSLLFVSVFLTLFNSIETLWYMSLTYFTSRRWPIKFPEDMVNIQFSDE